MNIYKLLRLIDWILAGIAVVVGIIVGSTNPSVGPLALSLIFSGLLIISYTNLVSTTRGGFFNVLSEIFTYIFEFLTFLVVANSIITIAANGLVKEITNYAYLSTLTSGQAAIVWGGIIGISAIATIYIQEGTIFFRSISEEVTAASLIPLYLGVEIALILFGLISFFQMFFPLVQTALFVFSLACVFMFGSVTGGTFKRYLSVIGWIRMIAIIVLSIVVLSNIAPSWESLKHTSDNYTFIQILGYSLVTFPIVAGGLSLVFRLVQALKHKDQSKGIILSWIILPLSSIFISVLIYYFIVPVLSVVGIILLILLIIGAIL